MTRAVISKTAETNLPRTYYVSALAGPRVGRRRVAKGDAVEMSEYQARALVASGALVADKALVGDPFGQSAAAATAAADAEKAAAEAKAAAEMADAEAKAAADKAAAEEAALHHDAS